ncbi:hypothetical protein HRI_004381400 [Hibiscus trionum]|uniref:Uncharacterized protein n=1 Tax=Hibiscus trionum TaxID=183268 RepID=A0A9W7MNM6_HIBTR|nr:hypothetical protein HRI_004381400 [Hibiscus trionum]
MANDTLETTVPTESNQNTSRDPTNNNTHVPETVQVIPNVTFAKPFPDISKIEVFDGENFKRWQEHVHSILDMHGVAFALTESLSPTASEKQIECWIHANKVCRHTIISTLSNEIFDVYCPYKESKEIWDNMILNYTAEDVGKQKIIIGKFYRWEMTEDVEVKVHINEHHKLLEDLKLENITLPEEFVAGLLIEKIPHHGRTANNNSNTNTNNSH